VLFRKQTLEGISRGEVTLAFRRWKKPTVTSGGGVRTAQGVVRLGRIDTAGLDNLTEADATMSGLSSLAALRDMLGPDDGEPIYRIELLGLTKDERVELRAAAEPTDAEWQDIRRHFDRWQKSAPGYFPSILAAIARSPEIAAAKLAADLAVEKLKFKQDVRKLKELGLTESLDIGYRLSPRGRTVLDRISK
jgi:hypothetical protein